MCSWPAQTLAIVQFRYVFLMSSMNKCEVQQMSISTPARYNLYRASNKVLPVTICPVTTMSFNLN